MSQHTPVNKPIQCLLPMDVEGFDSPAELALDMRWSWNHAADEVWGGLGPVQLPIQPFRQLNAEVRNWKWRHPK